ncbi:Uncharacterised protein [uncultured archaeon]|nr:Uncharacterised protein [uncultured archaeon]
MVTKTVKPIVAGILLIITTVIFLIIIAWQAFDLLVYGINVWDGLFVFFKAWLIVFGLFGAFKSLQRDNFYQSILGAFLLIVGVCLTTIVYIRIPSVFPITYTSIITLTIVIVSIVLIAISKNEFTNRHTWSDRLQE